MRTTHPPSLPPLPQAQVLESELYPQTHDLGQFLSQAPDGSMGSSYGTQCGVEAGIRLADAEDTTHAAQLPSAEPAAHLCESTCPWLCLPTCHTRDFNVTNYPCPLDVIPSSLLQWM